MTPRFKYLKIDPAGEEMTVEAARAIDKFLEEFRRKRMRRLRRPGEWKRYVAATLRRAKRTIATGRDEHLWDAVAFCERNNITKPLWLREWLIQYADERTEGLPLKKRGGHPFSKPADDLKIFFAVERCRTSGPKKLSLNKAFVVVKEELAERGIHLNKDGAIRHAYRRGKSYFLACDPGIKALLPELVP